MTQYREILRLESSGLSQRSIAGSVQCSRNTVAEVLRRAKQKELTWPLPMDVTDTDLQEMLFPEKLTTSNRKIPDYVRVHKEMARSGVTLTLLWSEYCESCAHSGEIPFQYTQFYKRYRKFAATTKATMHFSHKPGELMEVDWAGKTSKVTDSITGGSLQCIYFCGGIILQQICVCGSFPNTESRELD